jgi:homoserine kinase
MQDNRIRVRVPATTANLGPGFDCLGMALDLWNEVWIEVDERTGVSVHGQGAADLPSDRSNLVYRAMQRLFAEARLPIPEIRLHCHNEIPLKRGLGSSAAAIVGGLVAANLLIKRLGESERLVSGDNLLDMAVHLEGHPDNVAAALLGGLQLIAREEDGLLSVPVPVPNDIHAVLFVPDMTIATEEARAVLPRRVSREDAVYNMGRTALLVNALATGRLSDLRVATRDRLHQPYRQKLFPAMKVIFTAALAAGALGVFLSGSGSTILALTGGREMTVAYEMAEAARQANVIGQVKITRPTLQGAHQVTGDSLPTRELFTS